MKLDQSREYNNTKIFFEIYAENQAGETKSRPLIYFLKKPNMR